TVCVVGKMRDRILQLSKSSIYSTKPLSCYVFTKVNKKSMLYLLAICYVCQVITKRYAGSFVTRDFGGMKRGYAYRLPGDRLINALTLAVTN
ncbi:MULTISPECIES: hypothetical protein, partial [Klebsiella]